MLHLETIDPPTLELLSRLMHIREFSELNLVGGTSLALQIGHRRSIDLDLFGYLDLDDYQFTTVLKPLGSVQLINKTSNIKTYLINKIKVDFVNYPYPWLAPCLLVDGIRLAAKSDIAAMKLAAITGRGSKKDFIDIGFLLDEFSMEMMLKFYRQKFPDGSEFLVLKSLTYFEDAENEQLPVMLKKVDWNAIKSKIILHTKNYLDIS
ncbi:nucleotidyl transferase AbiEii/AbiGii toxin family protein [Gaoshiqia sp. Z1-71]|uniref:nucleotidyl transferase AbiEii/AbiGii toxin family protein n=1 Tax=Gaoshiqia hydrogeniformans TaxID=3290090 RepID=UPI003BF77814